MPLRNDKLRKIGAIKRMLYLTAYAYFHTLYLSSKLEIQIGTQYLCANRRSTANSVKPTLCKQLHTKASLKFRARFYIFHQTWLNSPSDENRSALPANPTSLRPRSWSLCNATLVVAERSGWRRVFGASKPRPSAKGAHPYRKRACLEALRLVTTKLTQRGTGYPCWGHPTQLTISRRSTGLIHKWQLGRERGQWIQV